jgi:FkbM family methyltransferase
MIQRFLIKAMRRLLLPRLPLPTRLRWRYAATLRLRECEPELQHLFAVVTAGDTAIDVGANSGLYTYSLAQRFQRVLAFEINADLTSELAAHNPGNIDIVHQGLSDRAGVATLYIPILKGRPLTGWASLRPGNCPDTEIHLEKSVNIERLDDRTDLQSVSFIKIDVEGHEREVLQGAYETIKTHRPQLLIEVKSENLAWVSQFFAALNYQYCQLQDLIGIPGTQENYFFMPEDLSLF